MPWSSFVVFYGHDNCPVVIGMTRKFGRRWGRAGSG